MALLLILCVCLPVGCQTFRDAGGLLEGQSETAGMTTQELRAIMNDVVLQVSTGMEASADAIIQASEDPAVRKNALLWKTNGIASCFQAATRHDPLAAFLDIWILNKQSLNLFRQPQPLPLFGDSQAIAVRYCLRVENAMQEILNRIGKEFPIGEGFASQFATDFPIEDLYFDRASMAAHYTRYLEKITLPGRDLKAVVSGLDTQIDQMQKLSSMYAEFLPKQARWQAEILVMETLQGDTVTGLLADISRAVDTAELATQVVTEIPDMVEREREVLKTMVSQERLATLEALQRIQQDTLGQLESERVAILEQLKSERVIILQTLQNERQAATGDFTYFGGAVVDRMDRATDLKIERLAEHAYSVSDHILGKLAQAAMLMLGVTVVTALGVTVMTALCLVWLHRRYSPTSDRHPAELMSEPETRTFRPNPGVPGTVDIERRRAA